MLCCPFASHLLSHGQTRSFTHLIAILKWVQSVNMIQSQMTKHSEGFLGFSLKWNCHSCTKSLFLLHHAVFRLLYAKLNKNGGVLGSLPLWELLYLVTAHHNEAFFFHFTMWIIYGLFKTLWVAAVHTYPNSCSLPPFLSSLHFWLCEACYVFRALFQPAEI